MNMFKTAKLYETEDNFKYIDNESVEVDYLDISNKNNYTGYIIRLVI